jgi:choline dehydrogenase
MAPLGMAEEKPHATQEEAASRHDKQRVTMADEPVVSAYMSPVHPRGRGVVRLKSGDPAEAPIIEHPMLADARDIEDLTAAGRKVREIFGSAVMKPYVLGENLPTRDVHTDSEWETFIRGHAFGGSHWVGTARMGGPGDPMAVVDPSLRVRGVAGLRVVDASVMPTLTSGNTNAPTVMIGERGAFLIREGG